jgi:hypothetical protein
MSPELERLLAALYERDTWPLNAHRVSPVKPALPSPRRLASISVRSSAQ